jgi:hypothetical protein
MRIAAFKVFFMRGYLREGAEDQPEHQPDDSEREFSLVLIH